MRSAKRRAATRPDGQRAELSTGRKHSFPPVVDSRTKLLILGSLPGERSLEACEYYAHPQNQFWRLVGAVAQTELAALPYERRLAELLAARIGLWDVIASARRAGSLDTSIEDLAANDVAELARSLPELRAVAFNGGKAAAVGRRALEGVPGLHLVTLPSSSPAHTLAFAGKLTAWMELARWPR